MKMAEQGGSIEAFTLTLLNIQNVKGHKSDSFQVTVKIEFGERILGESGKIECSAGTPSEINYSAQMMIPTDDAMALDDLVSKPIICTVIEVLPKEKKQKEEKTVVLGQCSIDIKPVIIGQSKNKMRVQILPNTGSPLDNLTQDPSKPELEILLNLSDSVVRSFMHDDANLLSLTVESLYALPESWNLSPGFNYVAATSVPNGEKENLVVFTGGHVKPSHDKEAPNKQRKWPMPGTAQGPSVFIADKKIATDTIEEENGELRTLDEQEFRRVAEHEKFHLTWNMERRCYLDSASTRGFKERIGKCRYLPVEVFRTILPSAGKPKGKDEDAMGFRGIAYVDVSPLLYPGVKRIRGAFKVTAFTEQELFEKTNKRTGIAEEALKIANGIMTRNTSPAMKPGAKKDESRVTGKTEKKQTSGMKSVNEMLGGEAESVHHVNVEGMQYVEAKSYIMIELELQKPLIRKKDAAELAIHISELVPPRPLFPKKTASAQKVVADFHNQVGTIANQLLDEFRVFFNDGICSYQPNSVEDKRQNLLYHLNACGKYLAFKEQLKYSVVKIVREKYLRTSNFQDNNELQAFLSELYVYLVDEMHVGLGKVLAVEDQRPIPGPLTDSAQLKHFAREAEVNGNFDLAAKFYQERIARDRNDPDLWLDYGTFCVYLDDLTKAEECFRECLAIDQRHLHGLLLNGIICSMLGRNESAETFFEAATTYSAQSILAWTIFGLFYLGVGNEIGAEMALSEAERLNVAAAAAAAAAAADLLPRITPSDISAEADVRADERKIAKEEMKSQGKDGGEPEESRVNAGAEKQDRSKRDEKGETDEKKESKEEGKAKVKGSESVLRSGITEETSTSVLLPPEPTLIPPQTIYMQAGEFLLDVKASSFAERALAQHLTAPFGGPSAAYHIALAQLKLQRKCFHEAEVHVKDAMQVEHQCPDAWAIMGHVKYLTGDMQQAKNCYERTLAFVADASEMHSIYLRLASIYLQERQFRNARDTFLMACRRSPSCVSWLGVGIACYRLGDLVDAEDALTEANILDNMDPEVWAYLCLICLQTGRQLEAEQSYKYTLKLNLDDRELLSEINQLQQNLGFGNPQY